MFFMSCFITKAAFFLYIYEFNKDYLSVCLEHDVVVVSVPNAQDVHGHRVATAGERESLQGRLKAKAINIEKTKNDFLPLWNRNFHSFFICSTLMAALRSLGSGLLLSSHW